MKKIYEEPEFDVRNYAQSLDSVMTLSSDLNDGNEFHKGTSSQNSEGIL